MSTTIFAEPSEPETGASRWGGRPIVELVFLLVAGGVLFWLAFEGGGYALVPRDLVGIAIWWTIALTVALGLWPRARLTRGVWATGGLLIAFAAFTGFSGFWAKSTEGAFDVSLAGATRAWRDAIPNALESALVQNTAK